MSSRLCIAAIFLAVSPSVLAQAQQAGNAASTNTQETFQKLVEQCDDTDVLMLRARIRLDINRTTPEAAEQASELLKAGLTHCSAGDKEAATKTLTEALSIAKAGAEEKFAITEKAELNSNAPAKESDGVPVKPWWKFW